MCHFFHGYIREENDCQYQKLHNIILIEVNVSNGIYIFCYSDESQEVWIGLTRAEHNCEDTDETCQRSNWVWADQTPYRYSEFHKWGNQDPQSDELCARIDPTQKGEWYGRPCDRLYGYICEKGMLYLLLV